MGILRCVYSRTGVIGRLASRSMAAMFAVAMSASVVSADLLPNEVVLVWNSKSADSTAVREAYVAARPGVREFDLSVSYTAVPFPTNPPQFAITANFVTPDAYETLIRQPLKSFVDTQAPETLCFVTTIGVPVLITNNFQPGVGHGNENGVVASVEGALTVLGATTFNDNTFSGARNNPYAGTIKQPFRSFVQAGCAGGRLFMATRLHAGPGPGTTTLTETLAMIDRSQQLVVNKFATNFIVDDVAGGCVTLSASRAGAQSMRDAGWLVWFDDTDEFLHGPSVEFNEDPQCPCPLSCQSITFEDLYDDYPDLTHASLGRNHLVICDATSDRECVSATYVQALNAHPAGIFASVESFNGLRLWGGSTGGQGNGLDWFGHAGGSFALLHGYGHFVGDNPQLDNVMLNFYENGMSWAEAAMSSLPKVGFVTVPIGDPLATVTVFDPDVTDDGVIDPSDIEAVFDALDIVAQDVLRDRRDVNRDGLVSFEDVVPVLDAFGRVRPTDQGNPIVAGAFGATLGTTCELFGLVELPLLSTGDTNGDLIVDDADVQVLIDAMACQCLEVDVNGDGVIDQLDIDIAIGGGDPLDIDGDGTVTCLDMHEVFFNQCFSNCGETPYDLTGDGVVNFFDFNVIATEIVNTTGIGSFFDLDFDGSGAVNCDDIQLLRDNYCDAGAGGVASQSCFDPMFDVNSDGVVNCTDEWTVEWVLMTVGGQPCNDVGLGCGECEE
ncbi:MAG: hypothetical protein AAF432_08640 [Planctomycetota bacterium]